MVVVVGNFDIVVNVLVMVFGVGFIIWGVLFGMVIEVCDLWLEVIW